MSLPALTAAQLDALRELMNIGVGRAARSLAELTGREVALRVIEIETLDPARPDQLADLLHQANLRISQPFSGGLEGFALLTLTRDGAVRIAQLLLDKSAQDDAFDELEQGALLELGNIVIGAAVGMLATGLQAPVRYELPQLQLRGIECPADLFADLFDLEQARALVMRASLTLREDTVNGYLILLFPGAHLVTLGDCLARALRP
jgi:chemotaxis protein CheC